MWFRKADNDLQVAEWAANANADFAEIACFHAQQCAEKYLKGYLVSKEMPFKFVHELAYLVRLCMNADPDFSALLDAAAELQDYSSDVRYPSEEFISPSREEAQEAVERAKSIRDFVLSRLSEKP